MKILKFKKGLVSLDKLKVTPQFKKIIEKYKTKKKLSQKKKLNNPLIESIKMKIEKSQSEKEYFIKEMELEKKINEEMKNMFGLKALNGRSNKDFQIVEKKVIKKVKLGKSSLLINIPFYSPEKIHKDNNSVIINKSNSNNDYFSIEKKKLINLPLIFPKRNKSKNNYLKLINDSDFSEFSSDKINSFKNSTISFSSITQTKSLNNCLSAKTLLDSLDSIRNEYKNSSKKINKFQKLEKKVYDQTNLIYNNLRNKYFGKN
jgi:hypothetical protein